MHASACLAPRRRYSGRAFNASDICAGRSGAGTLSFAQCDQPLGTHQLQPLARDGIRPALSHQSTAAAADGQDPATATAGLRPARRWFTRTHAFSSRLPPGSHSFCARAGCHRLDTEGLHGGVHDGGSHTRRLPPSLFEGCTCPAAGVTNERLFCFSIQSAERQVFKRLDSPRAARFAFWKLGRNHQQIGEFGFGTHRHIACY